MKVRHVHDRKAKHPGTHGTPRRFTLSVTEGEVDFLIAITAGVGGDPVNSPRKYAMRINEELVRAAGYGEGETDADLLQRGMTWFMNYDSPSKPSRMKAMYNHIRDTVLTLGCADEKETGVPELAILSVAAEGDRLARAIIRKGESIEDLPAILR
jgi:uncharacterized protein (DUF849 family)